MIKTLVIGGNGYIGRHLLPMLLASGRVVTVLSRNAKKTADLPQDINYIKGDFGNLSQMATLLDANDEIIHLANATVPNTFYLKTFPPPFSYCLKFLREIKSYYLSLLEGLFTVRLTTYQLKKRNRQNLFPHMV